MSDNTLSTIDQLEAVPKKLCRWGVNCHNTNCKFRHNRRRLNEQQPQTPRSNFVSQSSSQIRSPNYSGSSHSQIHRPNSYSNGRYFSSDLSSRNMMSSSNAVYQSMVDPIFFDEDDEHSLFMRLRLSPIVNSSWSPAVAGRFSFDINLTGEGIVKAPNQASSRLSPHAHAFHSVPDVSSVCVPIDDDLHLVSESSVTTASSVHSGADSDSFLSTLAQPRSRSASHSASHAPVTYANIVSCGWKTKDVDVKAHKTYVR